MNLILYILSFYLIVGHSSSTASLIDASNVFDKLCTSTIPLHSALQPEKPTIKKLFLRHMTPCRNLSVPLANAQRVQQDKLFDRTKKTVILATGWLNTINKSDGIAEMSEAFFCRKDVNFLVVDMASYMDTNYKWAAINTELIGKFIATGLKRLVNIIPLKNIHLVGHSLGAHIMGAAGRSFTAITNGRLIPRITGLDPAKPCFGDDLRLSSLKKGDARFVDVIHTNPGVLAIREPLGNMDFYPDGLDILKPGCLAIDCSHSRAVDYFVESIYPKNAKSFPAYRCQTFKQLELNNNCAKVASERIMGFTNNGPGSGVFYVKVNSGSPFGENGKIPPKSCKKNC